MGLFKKKKKPPLHFLHPEFVSGGLVPIRGSGMVKAFLGQSQKHFNILQTSSSSQAICDQ
jgi:hypothetical protein